SLVPATHVPRAGNGTCRLPGGRTDMAPTPSWSELRRRFGWEWNGMRLHEMCFANLTRKRANLEKAAGLGAQMSRDFSSHVTWHGG
ncbi:MAG: hypothetical protein ACXWFQ_06365, partial [Thermoanaerobaculia bacterium]